jgi:GT2 family glycosyltransferase
MDAGRQAGLSIEALNHRAVVVVLNFNGLADTMTCLASLVPQRGPRLEVLVVDNGSTDDPTAEIHAVFADLPVLRLEDNHGWAGGNNAGIAWARTHGADVVCLLNNDTIVPAASIGRLADVARDLAPCLLHPAIDYAEPGAGAQLDPSRWQNSPRLAGHPDIYVLNYAYGACLVVPVQVFDCIGIFDERFFLQLEETDFHARAERAGIPSLCLPEVRIIHAESRSFGQRFTPLKTYYISRNTLLFSRKHDHGLAERMRTIRKLYWNLSGLAGHGRDKPLSLRKMVAWLVSANPHAQAARHGIYDYIRNRFGKMRSIGSG